MEAATRSMEAAKLVIRGWRWGGCVCVYFKFSPHTNELSLPLAFEFESFRQRLQVSFSYGIISMIKVRSMKCPNCDEKYHGKAQLHHYCRRAPLNSVAVHIRLEASLLTKAPTSEPTTKCLPVESELSLVRTKASRSPSVSSHSIVFRTAVANTDISSSASFAISKIAFQQWTSVDLLDRARPRTRRKGRPRSSRGSSFEESQSSQI